MFVALSVGFASCGDDDENGEVSEASLVGTWESTYSEGWFKDSEYPEDEEKWNGPTTGDEISRVTFKANGTGDDGEGDSFTWTLKGNVLTTTYDDGEMASGKVLKLTDKELVTEHTIKEGAITGYSKDTFKRIK